MMMSLPFGKKGAIVEFISPDRGQADRKPQTAHFDHPLFCRCGEQLLRIVMN
jgi:hypothetical protein